MVTESIRDFYLRTHRELDRMMSEHGASLAKTKLLLFIERAERTRSADIAAHFGYAPRTVTEAIDGLERDGLVGREPDPSDRRAKIISITPVGLLALKKTEPLREAFLDRLYSILDDTEREALVAIMRKLIRQLDA